MRKVCLILVVLVLGAAGPPSELFEKGKAAYRLGEFDEAIAHFREAYRVKPDPVFLYNIALAYRGKEDLEKAIFFYQSYLREAPQAANRAQVEAKVDELRRALDEKERAAQSPPKTPLAPDSEVTAARPAEAPRPAPAPPSRKRRSTPLVAGVAIGGGALACGVIGVLLLADAAAAQREVNQAASQHEPWTGELADRDRAGRRHGTLGWVALGVGVTGLAAGGALVVLWLRQGRSAEIVPSASPGGVAVTLRGTF